LIAGYIVIKDLLVDTSSRYPVAPLTTLQLAVKLVAVTLLAFRALGAAGVGVGVEVGVGVGRFNQLGQAL
jgi:hypothetical protein